MNSRRPAPNERGGTTEDGVTSTLHEEGDGEQEAELAPEQLAVLAEVYRLLREIGSRGQSARAEAQSVEHDDAAGNGPAEKVDEEQVEHTG
jgi:hypothetical protein